MKIKTLYGTQFQSFLIPNNAHLQISPSVLKQLIDKIKDTMTHLDEGEESEIIKTHFANTVAHIKLLQSSGDSTRYDGIGV